MTNENILQYVPKIWQKADLLIGAGIKQSDFPKYMMPFFALLMVESRLIREANSLVKDFGVDSVSELDKEALEDFIDEFEQNGLGYNDFIIRKNKKLSDICENDKTFEIDYHNYLKAFDAQTKYLLGVDKGNDEVKFLDISGISGLLKKKKILFSTVKSWSEIDLVDFNNSEITTLEEHIKRKWADISAETAGEQYTPDDVISLISEIILSKIKDNGKFLTIYDPTCGGGNMLFGVEDKINQRYSRPIKTFGEDWNDTLYALAKIESRFREDSIIEYGNSLTGQKFSDKQFNIIVANPPYGVDWKGFKKDIETDETDRFVALPSVSDGQFLFTQHILSQLDDKGLAIVVHNGSTLFSGDAGSGESTIRKYFFDNDYVEAIIQLPKDEFFNTGIYTYLWVFNKNKPKERRDKIIMINADAHYTQLKKSKGKKRNEMRPEQRKIIVDTLTNFEDNGFTRVFDKWHFYYNKQAIILTNLDENGKSYEAHLPTKINRQGDTVKAKFTKLEPIKITQIDDENNTIELTDFVVTTFNSDKYNTLKEYNDNYIKPLLANLYYKEHKLTVTTESESYTYDKDAETIIQTINGKQTALGCGKIVIKSSYKKATKTKEAQIVITAQLEPDYQKDYEIIPFSPSENENGKRIADFMEKYISKPFVYVDNVVGIELNFNKIFYKPEQLRDVTTIVAELNDLENQLVKLEKSLQL
ncbi:HsdM family class I SAM-dependent methyltransferase [Flagellimonas pacifica]|uniref:site-specific DNA-methyltransferase (adenine-specific) n=1 Tax=Flagellimonas pacifica TaxID=1247520 RepID=A0A285MS99_9FLAO|nr:N-6 DNA methylase [Allomuricauda parva]SNY99563.1 type I restriction enzyme M protein [Allomuricauda parva]